MILEKGLLGSLTLKVVFDKKLDVVDTFKRSYYKTLFTNW